MRCTSDAVPHLADLSDLANEILHGEHLIRHRARHRYCCSLTITMENSGKPYFDERMRRWQNIATSADHVEGGYDGDVEEEDMIQDVAAELDLNVMDWDWEGNEGGARQRERVPRRRPNKRQQDDREEALEILEAAASLVGLYGTDSKLHRTPRAGERLPDSIDANQMALESPLELPPAKRRRQTADTEPEKSEIRRLLDRQDAMKTSETSPGLSAKEAARNDLAGGPIGVVGSSASVTPQLSTPGLVNTRFGLLPPVLAAAWNAKEPSPAVFSPVSQMGHGIEQQHLDGSQTGVVTPTRAIPQTVVAQRPKLKPMPPRRSGFAMPPSATARSPGPENPTIV